jgi:hypothetical protein
MRRQPRIRLWPRRCLQATQREASSMSLTTASSECGILGSKLRVSCGELPRHEHLHRLTKELVAGVSELALDLAIDNGDSSRTIDNEQPGWASLERRSNELVGRNLWEDRRHRRPPDETKLAWRISDASAVA